MHTTSTLLRLSDKDVVVPEDSEGRHFRYRHPETGHVSEGADYYNWVNAAKLHRRSNNLPIPADFAAQMENQLCADLPPEWCRQERVGDQRVDTGFSLGDVVDWISAVASRFFSGQPLVSQEEADRRARICFQCPLNRNAGGCGAGCAKLTKYLTPGMLAKATPYDDGLKVCSVCRCFGKIMVWFPLSIFREAELGTEKPDLYPAWCWKKEAFA